MNKEILEKQLKILEEKSKDCEEAYLGQITDGMISIYKILKAEDNVKNYQYLVDEMKRAEKKKNTALKIQCLCCLVLIVNIVTTIIYQFCR